MLEEEVVFAFVEDESVGIVRPAEGGSKTCARPESFLINIFRPRLCGAIAVLRVDGVVVVDGNGQCLAGKRADGNRREPIRGLSVGELHIESFDNGVTASNRDINLLSGVVNGKHEPWLRRGNGKGE